MNLKEAAEALIDRPWDATTLAGSILRGMGQASIPVFVDYVSVPIKEKYYSYIRESVLDICVTHLGPAAAPILTAAVTHAEPAVKLPAMKHLKALGRLADDQQLIEGAILAGLENSKTAAGFAPVAAMLGTPDVLEKLWSLVQAKVKTVRQAASEAVATADPAALDRAAALQAEKSKDARWGGVLVLCQLATEPAVECLLARLHTERDMDVRDAIVRGLRAAGVAFDRIAHAIGEVNWNEIRERAAAIKGSPISWLTEEEIPDLPMIDGGTLERTNVKYLLLRQSRQADPMPDPEVAGLYRMIDRQKSGDFAHRLFNAFVEQGASKTDAWALITAAQLGDNRVLTALAAKVRSWADSNDQKLGTWGVEALALNGSVPALASLHAIAEKFKDNTRRKFAVIGQAAQEAVEKSAKRLKLSIDELGDALVPSLGFEPGRPRLVEAGKRRIEAAIGLDFKLAMKDLDTGKRVASIPKTAPAETQLEFKGLGKLLVEVAKAQSARLQRLMVRRHRWPVARWRELFQQQPVLFPFSVRLVWGAYTPDGTLVSTFRALPDRSLTDAADEPCELSAETVGIVHPIDLSAETLEAWRTHLSDYEIEQPFDQINRPVVIVPPELSEQVSYDGLKDATVNGFAFRGKAEKNGWSRGATGDGAMISSYRKRFDTEGIDAFAILDGLTAYPDPGATVKVEEIVFVPCDTTAILFLQRRLKLGDVPKMVYSESVGELMRIFGKV